MKEDFQNSAIKSHLQTSFKLDTLMQVSLRGIELVNMDWRALFELWSNTRSKRILMFKAKFL